MRRTGTGESGYVPKDRTIHCWSENRLHQPWKNTEYTEKHKNLSEPSPFKPRLRSIHPSGIEAVRCHLKELQDAGIIRDSESPFASPVVVVRKKNGDISLCVDYRKLNRQFIKDSYALPNIE